jgi:hypothetical protein
MTGLALFLLSYAGWFLFLTGTKLWPTATLPLLISSLTIAGLYIFSLAGLLLPGAWFLAGMGVALGLAGLFRSRERPKEYFGRLLEPGPAIFFLTAVPFWLLLSGTHYASWDEFSHWGFIAKEISLRDALPPLESALRFKDYPPGTALFQYYVTFFTGWSEGATAFAQVLLVLSAAAALMQSITWKQRTRLAVVLSLSYLLIILFNFKPQSLYVDHILGLLFGMSIASALISEDGTVKTLLRLAPTLVILPLIKAAGLVLALIAAAAVSTNHLIAVGTRNGRKKWLGSLCLCAALLLAPLIAAKSWNRHVVNMGAAKTFATKITPAETLKAFSGSAPEPAKTITANFKKALARKQVGRTIPPVFLVLILSLAAFAALRKEVRRRENLQIRAGLLWMLAGFIVYASGLLLLYLFSFSSYEGSRLASFGRYMGGFFLGWSFVTAAFFLRLPPSAAAARLARYAGWLIILTALFCLGANSFKKVSAEKTLLHESIREKAAYAVSKTPADAIIYIIWQGSDGFEPQVMAYELAPRITSTRGGSWSLGKPYGPEDVWTSDISPKDWQAVLMDYDYVMIGRADKQFRDRFASLFAPAPPSETDYLFKVTSDKGRVKLRPY